MNKTIDIEHGKKCWELLTEHWVLCDKPTMEKMAMHLVQVLGSEMAYKMCNGDLILDKEHAELMLSAFQYLEYLNEKTAPLN